MLTRDGKFAIAAATIAIISLVISAIVLRNISERQAGISARLQRISKLQDEMLRVQITANDELNYSNLYLSFYDLYQDNPRAEVMMQNAGVHLYKSYFISTLGSYDERVPEGLEKLMILQGRLAKYQSLFDQDFSAALMQTAGIRKAINEEKSALVNSIAEERDALQLEAESLGRRENRVQFLSTSIQLLSILLVLVKDAFTSKKPAV